MNMSQANHTELVVVHGLEARRVDPKQGVRACEPGRTHHSLQVVKDNCKHTNATICHDRSEALPRVLAALAREATRQGACQCFSKHMPSPRSSREADKRERARVCLETEPRLS